MSEPRSTKGYGFEQLSYEVIGACIDVQRQLGLHCMEVDYQRALAMALPKRELQYQREVEVPLLSTELWSPSGGWISCVEWHG